jgi:acetyl-CoA C-acetyltransferase
MLNAYIYDGLRTPFGRHAGALAGIRADDLAAEVLRALLARHPGAALYLEDVLLGCTNQAGEDARNVARNALLLAGLPVTVPGQTVNRLCASGLAAVMDAARAITAGEGELYLAGGVESMSRAPFVMAKAESAYSREMKVFDSTIGARFPNPRLIELVGGDSMPETGDNVAREFGISRDAADAFALASQQKYAAACQAGFFQDEIVPVNTHAGRKTVSGNGPGNGPASGAVALAADEHPRADSTAASLARLKPLAQGGVVTAGNASGINDGAAVLLIGSAAIGEKLGQRGTVRILSTAVAGVAPRIMGIGPVQAIHKALARANLTLAQMDVIEINEAFASQVLACLKLLKLEADDVRVNPNGGAIAIGHPLGASGARLALTASRQLQRSAGRYAVVSLCIGMGQGLAMVLERT